MSKEVGEWIIEDVGSELLSKEASEQVNKKISSEQTACNNGSITWIVIGYLNL